MNQTETAYADELYMRTGTEIAAWHFEAVKFKLAGGCFYTPDFMVVLADGTIEFVDVKGGGPIDDKSVVKIKCAAERFWQFRFVMEKRLPKHLGWKRTEF